MLNQFKRVANCYFLLISILMLIGFYVPQAYQSPLNPYSTIVLFIMILAIICIKEGVEDLQRANSDRYENEKIVKRVTFGSNGEVNEFEVKTQDIKGGDIVKLEGKMAVPADMVLILTSNWDDGNQCYVETANIDGETNLKMKNASADLNPLIVEGKPTPDLFRGEVEFEAPNKSIYTFSGAYRCKALEHPMALGPENVLLRSSLYSNTDWGYGIALYTGQETKVQMNNRESSTKMSGMEHLCNRAVEMVMLAQLTLCAISVISIYFMGFEDSSKFPYVYPTGDDSRTSELPQWLEMAFIFFLLFNNFIPISLYVTIEIVNLGQAQLINADEKMYDEKLDLCCNVKSSGLAQELGMVSNIFSDKTGTLTCNEMEFVKFYVDGTLYDVDRADDGPKPTGAILEGTHLPQNQKIHDFVRCLATCHTVIREKDGTYRAESPDELALVEGAAKLNCSVLERGTVNMSTSIFGERNDYKVRAVNQFNSGRKRASLLLEKSNGEYLLVCKGADNIMIPLCAVDAQQRKELDKDLLDLAVKGLRTLVIAQKKIDVGTAEKWLRDYADASSSMEDRAGKLEEVAAEIEQNMELLGITAIEDKLQDEVPEVIADLAKAGIVLWMLTGDKEETAINIGRSCNLVLTDTKLFMLTGIKGSTPMKEGMKLYNQMLETIYKDIQAHWVDGEDPKNSGYRDDGGRFVSIVFVLDGPSFAFFDPESEEQTEMFLYIGKAVRSVISCRLTPNQKESVVHLVKTNTKPKATCLSIGDGANDVSMILEADVGVGIYGKEGRQAANNADFAIGQFKFLKRLLLVHGRWNYIRQASVFLYSLHKNAVITMLLFWFNYYTGLSGTSPYQSWIYSGYNAILGFPIIIYGIMDRDLPADFVEANPQVYATGQTNSLLGQRAVVEWTANAIGYSIILSLIFYYAMTDSFLDQNLYIMGAIMYTGLLLAMQGKVAFLHHQWAWPQVLFMTLSLIGMFVVYLFSQLFQIDNFYGAVGPVLLREPTFWFMGFLSVPIILLLFEGLWYWVQLFFFPTNQMLYREIQMKVSPAAGDRDLALPLLRGGTAVGMSGVEGAKDAAADVPRSPSPVSPVSPSSSPNRIDQPLL